MPSLSSGETQQASQVIYAFWRANRARGSVAMRRLSTSDQPLRYAQVYWDMEGAFPDSTNLEILDAYRASGIRDTVFIEVNLLHVRCPPQTGAGAVHWRLELVPKQSWLIASLGSDPF